MPRAPRAGRVPGARAAALAAVAAAVAGAAAYAGVGGGEVANPGGLAQVERLLAAAAAPRADAAFLRVVADAALTTVAFAVLGTALALVLGLPGGLLAARLSWRRRAPWLAVRAALAVPRGVHEVVWGLVLLAVVGLDPLVAVLAIGLPYGAVTAKVVAELLDEAPRAPYAALRAAGAGRLAALLYGLLPLARADLVSYGFYRLECAIRSAAVLGLVGAGGLGFELALSTTALRHDELWTLLWALVLLGALADGWSAAVRRRGGRTAALSVLGALALVAWSWAWLRLDPGALLAGPVRERLGELAAGAWPPAPPPGGWGALARATAETLAMAVLAAAVACTGALLLALPAARTGGGPARRAAGLLTRAALLWLRAMPPPVWALVLLFVLLPGVLPGALALGVYNLGVVARLTAEAVEDLDARPAAALRAAGAGPLHAALYATLPGVAGRFAAFGLYRWEVAVRDTVVVGAVGAGGLGLLLADGLARFAWREVAAALLATIALTLAVDLAAAVLRRAVR